MLEVHPPQQTVHSWRDFFIHIATIVVGLLIAIGLEQMVERIHERYDHAVWDTAENKGIVRLMSLREANRNQAFYRLMTLMSAQSLNDWDAINDAHHFDLLDSDPTHLSAQQLNETIQLTATALAKHIQFGYSFGRYTNEFPDLPHTVTWDKIDQLRPSAFDTDPAGMAAAHQRTEDRIKAATEEQNRSRCRGARSTVAVT